LNGDTAIPVTPSARSPQNRHEAAHYIPGPEQLATALVLLIAGTGLAVDEDIETIEGRV